MRLRGSGPGFLWGWALTLLIGVIAVGCSGAVAPLRPELSLAANRHDAMALSEALERLIDEQVVTDEDREAAYHAVTQWTEPTAAYAFARAALAGRLAQVRGLTAIGLVGEAEAWARKSLEIDPKFRDEAAVRMLGTLYVLAPSSIVEHGDSETGLEMLEKLCERRPEQVENHLRVAEAYIALGDPDPAHEHLCLCLAARGRLRLDDQRLVEKLVKDAGGTGKLGCPAPAKPGAAPSVPP